MVKNINLEIICIWILFKVINLSEIFGLRSECKKKKKGDRRGVYFFGGILLFRVWGYEEELVEEIEKEYFLRKVSEVSEGSVLRKRE